MNKNSIIFLGGFILFSVDSFSMDKDTLRCIPYTDSISKIEYYLIVDSMPEYPGGQSEMINFFMSNFKYPQEIDACCKIIIEFIIDSTGIMSDLKVIRSLQEDFDKEALRVMRLMPKWKPGKCAGKTVPVKLLYPISISIQ